jgi:hypothetical protein
MIFSRLFSVLPPLAVLAVLGGCAEAPPPMAAMPYNGTWIVTDAFPSGAMAAGAMAPKGQTVPMEAARAGDVAGRVCLTPIYDTGKVPLATVTGAAAPDWMELSKTVTLLSVMCGHQPFATYAQMGDGALLTRYGGWLLRLERGDRLAANPAPMMAEPMGHPMPVAALPVPAAAPAPAAAAPPAKAMAPHTLVYLASYKTEAWAKKGWGILALHSAALKSAEPVMKTVEIKRKGKFVRLFAGVPGAQEAKLVCKELGRAVSECGVSGRD